MKNRPIEEIKSKLSNKLPSGLINKIPDKWEKIGDILILVLPNCLYKYKENIGKIYSEILHCKTVLNYKVGIIGEFRIPKAEIIYGEKNTTTIHKENGIKYKIDPCEIMFSSGNMDERIRMSNISNSTETVVDLFAGIGYFTLPIAFYGKPKKVIAVEKNPNAYKFLQTNIVLNNVVDIVEPIFGDNRIVTPKGIADRVIMGYIGDTEKFLDTAISCLKDNCGIIHFHDKFPSKNVPDVPLKKIRLIVEKYNRNVALMDFKCVKSYAPGIGHYVFDLEIED